MPDSIKFNFLKDEPIPKDQPGFFHFYHDNFSPALKEIIENDSCVHTIGLFGRWGTGKSTIIDLLKKELKLKVFVFDAWKYQEDALRRIFLIKLVDFLKETGVEIEDNILDPLYKSAEITTEEKKVDKSKIGFWRKLWIRLKTYWLFATVIVIGIAWGCLEYFSRKHTFLAAPKDIATSLFALAAVAAVLKPILQKVLEEAMSKIFSAVLPWSEIRTKVEKEDRLNSPEQFESLFNEVVQSVKDRIVIVFDNVDRVQGDTAIKILSTIKTFLDPIKKADVIFIVPCDADAIIQQIKAFYGKDLPLDQTFDPSEYLRKLFNVIIHTPEFIDTDLEDYTKHLIGQTGGIKDLLIEEDVILVITRAFSNNPREIKQFINNLISTILVASKTEVNDLIVQKDKIAYLAKVLVLKQKFPDAYTRLKEKWYEPDNIITNEDSKSDLVKFLNATSRITTDDAEPYIYFKKPSVASNISNAQSIRQHLLAGDQEQFESAVAAETSKDSVIDYVLLLLRRYQNQHDPLLKIFQTQLSAFSSNGFSVSKKSYFDQSLTLLDNQLWEDFLVLPIETIFSFLLNNQLAERRLKAKIVERYVLALSSEQLRQPANKDFLLKLLKNFLEYPLLLSEEQKQRIAQTIEQNLATNMPVLNAFQTTADQDQYVTAKTFDQFIQEISRKNAEISEPTINQYKGYIEQHNLELNVLRKIQEWVGVETAESPDYRPQKETLTTAISKLIVHFREKIKDLPDEEKLHFSQIFTQAFNSIGSWDNRWIFVNILRRIWPRLNPPQQEEYKSLINQFFQQASPPKLRAVLEYWKKNFAATFLEENLAGFLPRVIENDVLGVVYEFASEETKLRIIKHLIKNKTAQGMIFVRSLEDNLPNRIEILRYLLEMANTLSPSQCTDIYTYVNEKLSKSDDTSVKDLAAAQIKNLLKNEEWSVQEIGYNFLSGATFLSVETKREIGKEILEHLRQPGKNITEDHRFSLKAVASLYATLQETPKRDFVYFVFDSIRQEKSKPAIEVFFSLLQELPLQFSEFEKDYLDLLERLKNWPDGETKNIVVSKLLELKPKSPNKTEKDYWSQVEELTPKEDKM